MSETKPRVITFDTCPNCGSRRRLADELAKDVKARGLMNKDLQSCSFLLKGIVQDMTTKAIIPIGVGVPAYIAYLDICMDCGTVYSFRIEIGEAKLAKPNKYPPTIHTS